MNQSRNWFTIGWVIWAFVTVGFFAIWETIGLRNAADDRQPLTFFIRKMAGSPNSPVWWLLGATLVWLLYHFLFVRGG
jgi:hypothetical protein